MDHLQKSLTNAMEKGHSRFCVSQEIINPLLLKNYFIVSERGQVYSIFSDKGVIDVHFHPFSVGLRCNRNTVGHALYLCQSRIIVKLVSVTCSAKVTILNSFVFHL